MAKTLRYDECESADAFTGQTGVQNMANKKLSEALSARDAVMLTCAVLLMVVFADNLCFLCPKSANIQGFKGW